MGPALLTSCPTTKSGYTKTGNTLSKGRRPERRARSDALYQERRAGIQHRTSNSDESRAGIRHPFVQVAPTDVVGYTIFEKAPPDRECRHI